jgi:hypothetical protein
VSVFQRCVAQNIDYSAISVSKRSEMMERISALGGVYSKTLDPSCTHLVIAQPVVQEGESVDVAAIRTSKVDWALRRNAKAESVQRRRQRAGGPRPAEVPSDEKMIMIVWEGWFWDCVSFNGRFPEEKWRLENQDLPPPPDYSAREQGMFILNHNVNVTGLIFGFPRRTNRERGRGKTKGGTRARGPTDSGCG